MWVIGTPEEVSHFPEWIKAFMTCAWARPDKNGQRHPIRDLDRPLQPGSRRREILARDAAEHFVEHFHAIGTLPGVVTGTMKLLEPRPPSSSRTWRIETSTRYAADDLRIALGLADVWNENRTLAECVVCGTLVSPGKGKIARTCSPACRLALSRQKKGLAKPSAAAPSEQED